MADPLRLSHWAYFHRERLGLEVTRFFWPERFSCAWQDVEARISVEGHSCIGRGTALSSEEAADRALGEAFERAAWIRVAEKACIQGFAVHPNREVAAQNAISELIERDAFFCHFLTGTALGPAVSLELLKKETGTLIEEAERSGVKVLSRRLAVPEGYFGVATFAIGTSCEHPFGVFVGLGCSASSEIAALRTSVLECARRLAAHLLNASEIPMITRDEILENASPGAETHIAWSKNPESWRTMEPLLRETRISEFDSLGRLELSRVRTAEIGLASETVSPPIHVIGATSDLAIRTFFGSPVLSELELERLKQFSGRAIQIEDLPMDPHPVG